MAVCGWRSFWGDGCSVAFAGGDGRVFCVVLCCVVTSRYGSFLETLFWKVETR